jgi:hypothetical protein
MKHRGGLHIDLQFCVLCALCGFFEGVLMCVFFVEGFWNAPHACEIITFPHYNICVYLRLFAVEIKKLTADTRKCTQIRSALVFWLACAPFFD